MTRSGLRMGLLRLALVGATVLMSRTPAAPHDAEAIGRLKQDVIYLASDELEGRDAGTRGIDLAADYLARRFQELGLKPAGEGQTYFQPFPITLGQNVVGTPTLELIDPNGHVTTLKWGHDFTVLAFGSSGRGEAPLAFGGYGIRNPEGRYDDFAELEARGKALLVMRREPRQADQSDRTDSSASPPLTFHSALLTKARTAADTGVVAIVFVTDPRTLRKEEDRLLPLAYGGRNPRVSIPVFHLRKQWADQVLKAAIGQTLEQLETDIDRELKPRSAVLAGWRLRWSVELQPQKVTVRNVLAESRASQGNESTEYVVVGAHYDHVGYGEQGSLATGSHAIHNGADDNASGTAAVLELARRLRERPLKRSVLFALFAGEERGLLGSQHFVEQPTVPLERVVAMVNLDMVGRLRDNILIVYGTGTSPQFAEWVPALAKQYGFKLRGVPAGVGPSDHLSFYNKKIPVLHFFTGLHADYHRPSDDADKLNYEGLERIVDFVEEVVEQTAEHPERLAFVPVAGSPLGPHAMVRSSWLGAKVTTSSSAEGVLVEEVVVGGPADKAGIQKGDVLLQLGDSPLRSVEDLLRILEDSLPGQRLGLHLRRGDQTLKLEVMLDEPPALPRSDRAYLGTIPSYAGEVTDGVLLDGVTPGGPAEKAGLRAGDVILKVGDVPVHGLQDLEMALRKYRPGQKVSVVVKREGKTVTLEAILGSR
jgi:hypothetical protein